MPLKNFIKKNFVLVVGLALPVLLVVLFFVTSVVPKSMVAPPEYEMLFTQTPYDNNQYQSYDIDFFVKGGSLKARVWRNLSPRNPKKKLMVYDGKTQTVREIPYDLSKIGDVPNQTEIALDEFKNMKVDGSGKAPDGYEFDSGGYNSGGLVTDLFAGGNRYNAARIVKGSAAFKIPGYGYNNYSYSYSIQFLGWIIQK